MSPGQLDRLARSRRGLAAARHLADGGFAAEAISRAYFAAFYAAEACLRALGQGRSKHSAVLSAFNELVVRPGEIAPDVGRILRSLFELRNDANYGSPDVPAERAASAIADAEQFVAAAETWLATRSLDPGIRG